MICFFEGSKLKKDGKKRKKEEKKRKKKKTEANAPFSTNLHTISNENTIPELFFDEINS